MIPQNTGWKIISASMVQTFKRDDILPVPGLSASKDLALLLVTVRPLQGEQGLGTISSLSRSSSPLTEFVLAHFTDNILDHQEPLPDWFLSEGGAIYRTEFLTNLMRSVSLFDLACAGQLLRYTQEATAAAAADRFADHLRFVHLACDDLIAWVQKIKDDPRDYAKIVEYFYSDLGLTTPKESVKYWFIVYGRNTNKNGNFTIKNTVLKCSEKDFPLKKAYDELSALIQKRSASSIWLTGIIDWREISEEQYLDFRKIHEIWLDESAKSLQHFGDPSPSKDRPESKGLFSLFRRQA